MHDLNTYFLPTLAVAEFLQFQRRLAFDLGEDPESGALLVCSLNSGVTVGREGSRSHFPSQESVQWVARGGGVLLHQPGQVLIAPILRLESIRLTPSHYRTNLQSLAAEVLSHFHVEVRSENDCPGLFVESRQIAHIGLAVRGGITSFGLTINVNCNLEPFHTVRVDGHPEPMTSLERESPHRVRMSTVRQQMAEAVAACFGFARLNVFHQHPSLPVQQQHDETADDHRGPDPPSAGLAQAAAAPE